MKETAKNRPPIQRQVPSPQPAPPTLPRRLLQQRDTGGATACNCAGQALDSHAPVQKVVVKEAFIARSWTTEGHYCSAGISITYRTVNKAEFEMIAANHMQETRPFPGALVFDDPNLTTLANGEL